MIMIVHDDTDYTVMLSGTFNVVTASIFKDATLLFRRYYDNTWNLESIDADIRDKIVAFEIGGLSEEEINKTKSG